MSAAPSPRSTSWTRPTRPTRIAIPYSFSLGPDLTIHRVYDGGWFVGRPTLEELRQDLRALMQLYHPD